MTIEQLKVWFVSRGYSPDKYGHYQKNLTQGGKEVTYRYKIQACSIRKELQCKHAASEYAPANNSWIRIASGYISKLSINDKNQLVGLK
jgi:hypothetical protein